jgi:D-glycero-beta-D-manno-heptose-7-phosphate kinase
MSRSHNSERQVSILESLSDITITVVSDFIADEELSGGGQVAVCLADLGISVFVVGVVGEDEPGKRILKALHDHRISTSGISKIKNFSTPTSLSERKMLIHEEHRVLLNVVENARKFVSASDAVYICDLGIGAASPRVLNFIKSKGSLQDKTLAARSLDRLVDFEQLTTAIANDQELELGIGIEIGNDEKKLAIAGTGVVQAMRLASLLVVNGTTLLAFEGRHKPTQITLESQLSASEMNVIGAIFASSIATGADAAESAALAGAVVGVMKTHASNGKRLRREDLLSALTPQAMGRARK